MYLPFVKERGRPKMGLKSLTVEDWIEIDQDFCVQLLEKQRLLQHCYSDVFVAQDNTQLEQKEILSLLTDHLLQHFPDTYQTLEAGLGIRN